MKKHRLISFLSGEFNFVLKLLSMPKCIAVNLGSLPKRVFYSKSLQQHGLILDEFWYLGLGS